MLNGLRNLHKKGIVHRDIKCENVLIHFPSLFKILDPEKLEKEAYALKSDLQQVKF